MNLPTIYLLDQEPGMVSVWALAFEGIPVVHVVQDDFAGFMDVHPQVDCIVAPGNSYGLMDAGYDAAIISYFGEGLKHAVQRKILDDWFGEQPVGTSMSIEHAGITLVHTPVMRVPSVVRDSMVVYHAARSALIEAMRRGVKAVVLPAFGAGCGKVPHDVVARLMAQAYRQLADPPAELSWHYAHSLDLPDSLQHALREVQSIPLVDRSDFDYSDLDGLKRERLISRGYATEGDFE
ncbi:macro domain-containing protein [Denitrobacterium detoxificans]|uniref:O-acetyl-ADP-ribose deacetylase (Regulator of RNase III), contains Macro domain n=1 Tax=Denitrobacterium detoxificans TaxID=79604 RepID=A0A1H8SD86_9ACTN|nr:macro domain-containing protein [Denitrobacterium detoxificans]SEO76466.1 O-acetyl-ADP-ribose deacetylase (regulator of RNase III), contains Macro domain [Denitrobacterium detoxificans]